MASTVLLNDCGLNNGTLSKIPLNSTEISHSNNSVHKTTENMTILQKTADKQACETNGIDFKNTGDKMSASSSPPQHFTPQKLVTFSCSTSASPTPLQQGVNCNGIKSQSIISPADVNAQQKETYKSQPGQQNNYQSSNLVYTNQGFSSALTEPPNHNQLDTIQRLNLIRQGHGLGATRNIKCFGALSFIGWVDILSAIFLMTLAVHNIFAKPILDPDEFMWQFFIGFLVNIVRLLMGIGLLCGLKNDDDFTSLWYCKLWTFGQLLFIFSSIVEIIVSGLKYAAKFQPLYPNHLNRDEALEHLGLIALSFGLLVYRIICFVLVRLFVGSLKKSQALTMANDSAYPEFQQHQRQTFGEAEEEDKFDRTEGTYGLAYLSLIL